MYKGATRRQRLQNDSGQPKSGLIDAELKFELHEHDDANMNTRRELQKPRLDRMLFPALLASTCPAGGVDQEPANQLWGLSTSSTYTTGSAA